VAGVASGSSPNGRVEPRWGTGKRRLPLIGLHNISRYDPGADLLNHVSNVVHRLFVRVVSFIFRRNHQPRAHPRLDAVGIKVSPTSLCEEEARSKFGKRAMPTRVGNIGAFVG